MDRDAQTESGAVLPGNSEIRDVLRRRAQQTGKSLRWNRNILLLTYVVLAATLFVALRLDSAVFAAIVAVPGLAIVWVFSAVQARRLERETFEDDMREYTGLLSKSQPAQGHGLPSASTAPSNSPLSDREIEVLTQIAGGHSNKETALALFISEQTVKNHLKHIFDKLHVSDRTSAVLTAVRNRWIDSGTPARQNRP